MNVFCPNSQYSAISVASLVDIEDIAKQQSEEIQIELKK
jgi:hypothetical protein